MASTIPGAGDPATAEERPHLWRVMVSARSGYAAYQQRTTREIPVILLEPDSK
ncbi:nitroreductase/quinone reductase family protein [Micromonospora sp. NPDC050276]|uniref:nitroreductase/quinone reductase family protein n=1 Tax=Micromonospora sp. NPDC050276 TaxID=3364278 RepID=UPI0037A75FE1